MSWMILLRLIAFRRVIEMSHGFLDLQILQDDFDKAVQELVEIHKHDGQWIEEDTVAEELQNALENIVDELLDDPTEYFIKKYIEISTHYTPDELPNAFDTREEAEDVLPDAEKYFGVPMHVVKSDYSERWFIEEKE